MIYDTNRPPVAVILAASVDSGLAPLTDDCPTSLLSVGGSLVIERMIRNCLSCGISQFVLVLGHQGEQIRQFVDKTFRGIRVTYVTNERYRDSGTGYSLMLASSVIGTAQFIKLDANVMSDVKILRDLVDSAPSNVLCIDRDIAEDSGEGGVVLDDQMNVLELGETIEPKSAMGATIGIEKIGGKAAGLLFAELTQMMENPINLKAGNEAAYEKLLAEGTALHALDVTEMNWTAINKAEDLDAANVMFGSPVTTVSRALQRAVDEGAARTAAAT